MALPFKKRTLKRDETDKVTEVGERESEREEGVKVKVKEDKARGRGRGVRQRAAEA